MPKISLHPGYGMGLLFVLTALAFVLVAVSYRRAFRSLPLVQFAWLYGLRMAAILSVLLLLFQPCEVDPLRWTVFGVHFKWHTQRTPEHTRKSTYFAATPHLLRRIGMRH